MVSLVKDIRISGLARSNLFITIMLLLVVVALFFIPELVSFQRSMGGGESRPRIASTDVELVPSVPEDAEKPAQPRSGLSKILGLLDSGYIESSSKRKMQDAANVEPESEHRPATRAERAIEDVRAALKLGDSGQVDAPSLVSGEPVTWKMIHAKGTQIVFKKAQKDALGIAKALPEQFPGSRYALLNFASGIGRVLDSGDKSMKADEALSYLSFLDQTVTESMLRERVDRTDYIKWAEVSLGPLLENSRAEQMKVRMTPSFNPKLTLTWVEVVQPADRFGRWKPTGRAYVRAEGFVVGKDAKKIELWKNGELDRRITLHKKADSRGRRFFKMPRRDARGLYTIQIIDRDGHRYSRNFNFYDRAAEFGWNAKGGRFMVPFQQGDMRFTSYFRVGGGSGSSAFSNFGQGSASFPMTSF